MLISKDQPTLQPPGVIKYEVIHKCSMVYKQITNMVFV